MRQDHVNVFFDAAQQCECWIGLREPNPLADRWIGRPGYRPKPETCKAKTADDPRFRLAGLVVDPTLQPNAFTPATRRDATETWKVKFLVGGRLPAGFACEPDGPDKGLVRLHGAALFADYDLMSIVRSNRNGERLFTSKPEQVELFRKVEPILRRGLGLPMIQHGTEFMWEGGVGARAFEWVLWFGPDRRFERTPSSMPQPHGRGGGH